jgi:hypothetical protein
MKLHAGIGQIMLGRRISTLKEDLSGNQSAARLFWTSESSLSSPSCAQSFGEPELRLSAGVAVPRLELGI